MLLLAVIILFMVVCRALLEADHYYIWKSVPIDKTANLNAWVHKVHSLSRTRKQNIVSCELLLIVLIALSLLGMSLLDIRVVTSILLFYASSRWLFMEGLFHVFTNRSFFHVEQPTMTKDGKELYPSLTEQVMSKVLSNKRWARGLAKILVWSISSILIFVM